MHIAIIEDDVIFSNELKRYLENQDEVLSVYASGNVEDFVQRKITNEPDIVLIDYQLPGQDGISAVPSIKTMFPKADIIILTIYADNETIFKGLCSGAVGYVLKDTGFPILKDELFKIRAGGSYMSPAIARKIFNHFDHNAREPDAQALQALTKREQQVVQYIVEGLSYKQIADKLYIAVSTVQDHIKKIYFKLNVNSKAGVIIKMRQHTPWH